MATSLDEILDHCSLKKQDLTGGECPQEIRIKIALKLTDWKVFGHILLIPKETLASIDAENQTENQKKIAVLDSWHERENSDATCFKLAEKLYEHNRRDLVTDLCELVKSFCTQLKADHSSDSRLSMPTLDSVVDAQADFPGIDLLEEINI